MFALTWYDLRRFVFEKVMQDWNLLLARIFCGRESLCFCITTWTFANICYFDFSGLICELIWKKNLLYILDFLCFLATVFICTSDMANCCFLHFLYVGACCIPICISSLYNCLPRGCISLLVNIYSVGYILQIRTGTECSDIIHNTAQMSGRDWKKSATRRLNV